MGPVEAMVTAPLDICKELEFPAPLKVSVEFRPGKSGADTVLIFRPCPIRFS
jgi:hypothetical protein